jgi:hypothetical protein
MEEDQNLPDLIKRKGKFVVNGIYCRAGNVEVLLTILEGIAVIHVESNFFNNTITYYGMSYYFDEIEEGETVPEYSAMLYTFEDRSVDVQWKKLD